MNAREQLWEVVRSIPAGRVASYGAVGRALTHPVSGLIIGRWMASCPPDIPWWRVVGSKGDCPVWKRDPNLFVIQKARLEDEGVSFEDGRVLPQFFADVDFPQA